MEKIIVGFSGLKNKEYDFSYNIDNEFFNKNEELNINGGDLVLNLHLDKKETSLYFTFNVSGVINIQCDRCLDYFKYRLDFEKLLFIKISDTVDDYVEESEDVLIIPSTEHEIDLTQYLYEFIMTELPLKSVHELGIEGDNQCNEEMIKILEEQNEKAAEQKSEIDPRWDALKKLKDKI